MTMRKASTSHAPLAVVDITSDDRSRLRLPARLWADGLLIGDRLIAECVTGETLPGIVAVGADLGPWLEFTAALSADVRTVQVRRPAMSRAA